MQYIYHTVGTELGATRQLQAPETVEGGKLFNANLVYSRNVLEVSEKNIK